MKKILIGTHNKGKFKEISYLISKKIKKVSPEKLKIKSPKETGKTFSANAVLKVNYFSRFTDLPVISDDSGLCINALGGKPGIYSARWAKKYGSFSSAMRFILKKMKNRRNRSAAFVCSLSLKYPKEKIVTVTGKITGSISHKILGSRGFGYDPIFVPRSKSITFGQMSKVQKIKIDHRYIAFSKMKKKIKIF
jgi:XTP/dITP diphosphohydrolase